MKERTTELVQGFRHSVPYINAHRGKTFVIMLSGEAIKYGNFSGIINDIGLLYSLEQVKQAAGRLQLDITARLSMGLSNTPLQGANINVVSGNFIIAQPLGVDEGVDYIHTGRIRRIDKKAIDCQLKNGAIVLIGPVAVSITGESFNLTSEDIATQNYYPMI
nr:hypothetical protein [Tanacetum cinerariifolium]